MQNRTPLLGLLIALTILFASIAAYESYLEGGTSRTTSTYFTSSTVIVGTTVLTTFPPGRLYDVTFNESRGCGGNIDEWGVQLGNLTITQPPNLQLLSIQNNGFFASGKFNLTTITFSVPSGTYPFVIYPTEYLLPAFNNSAVGDIRGSAGTVTVSNSSVTVDTISEELCV
jgi:hypothetical protein